MKKYKIYQIANRFLKTKICKYKKIKAEIAELEAIKGRLDADIKAKARKMFLDEIVNHKSTDPIVLKETPGGSEILFYFMGKYENVNVDKAKLIQKKYGKGFITKTTSYVLDPKVMELHGKKILDALMKADIPQEYKKTLLKSTDKFCISKGSISKINSFEKYSPEEVLTDIAPMFGLKDTVEEESDELV